VSVTTEAVTDPISSECPETPDEPSRQIPAKASERSAATDEMAEIYQRTIRPLSSMLRKHLGNGPPDPDDIAQNAYQRLMERPSLDDIKNIEGFLWRTARNLVFNERRTQAIRSRYDYELEQIFFPAEGSD